MAALVILLAAPPPGADARERPPNVVVIMTDDQTVEQLRVMEITRRRIGEQGVTFANSFVNWAICCPSRATFLTGQYAHNHGVRGNGPPLGGFEMLREANTLPVWLQRRGYHTVHIGKYLNPYPNFDDQTYIPRGWSEWYTAVGDTRVGETQDMYEYDLNENGAIVSYGSGVGDYKTDVFTDRAVEVVDRLAPGRRPLFLAMMYNAPHFGGPNPNPQPPSRCDRSGELFPPKPAVRHAGAFANEPLPQPPSFNRVDPSHPARIKDRPSLTEAEVAEITRSYRCELASLLAVDEGVGRIVGALRRSGELGRTLVIFTSDNGFFHGELRIPHGKLAVYEPSIGVPLLIRGPGVPRGRTVRDLVVNADLAPTIARLAGARPGLRMDGRSLILAADRPNRLRGRPVLLDTNQYTGVRTNRYVFSQLSGGRREVYDLRRDPHQLRSVHRGPRYARARRGLVRLLRRLRGCAGQTCRQGPRVRLEIRRPKRGAARSCRRRALLVGLRGRERREVRVAALRIGGRPAGRLPPRSFERTLGPRRLGASRRVRVRVVVELHDGRRMTLDRRPRRCPGGPGS